MARRLLFLLAMGIVKDFKAFISKGNVIDLAVAVVIGAAFTKIVNAFVEGLIMPIVGAVFPSKEWSTYTITSLHIKVGMVLAAVIDFLIIAVVVFLMIKALAPLLRKPDAPAAPATRTCAECLETIPLAARRCRACTAVQVSSV